jgi:hypothetical protein
VAEIESWKKRYTNYSNELGIIRSIKVKTIECVGNPIRASRNKMIKLIFNIKPEGTRKMGRPRLRWKKCLCQDIRSLGIINWELWHGLQENGPGL